MLKALTDNFPYGMMEHLSKVKTFLLHAAGNSNLFCEQNDSGLIFTLVNDRKWDLGSSNVLILYTRVLIDTFQ